MANPGFAGWETPIPEFGAKTYSLARLLTENCMEMKDIGLKGGPRPWRPPWIRQYVENHFGIYILIQKLHPFVTKMDSALLTFWLPRTQPSQNKNSNYFPLDQWARAGLDENPGPQRGPWRLHNTRSLHGCCVDLIVSGSSLRHGCFWSKLMESLIQWLFSYSIQDRFSYSVIYIPIPK